LRLPLESRSKWKEHGARTRSAMPSMLRSQGGLGIGLSLVKGLVEMHGGSVQAHSEGPGRGSEFVVRLPAAVAGSEREETPPPHGTCNAPLVKRRILVVDDNRDSVDTVAVLLRDRGNEVRTAFDGLEAVETAAAFGPDVILLDIGLPKLNGYDTCRRIRQQPRANGIAIIAVSGRTADLATSRHGGPPSQAAPRGGPGKRFHQHVDMRRNLQESTGPIALRLGRSWPIGPR
jgi:CheY-like chemotaxis protein